MVLRSRFGKAICDGRPRPPELRPNDVAAWQTRVVVRDVAAGDSAIRAAHAPLLSPGVVTLPSMYMGFASGLLAQDPDGHEIALTR